MTPHHPARLLTLAAALVLLAPAKAQAGNAFTFPAGGRAAAMAGAYAALADDPASAWWNPAGLGWTDRSSLDVSASAYHVQFLQIPEFIRTTLPAETLSSGLSANPFQVVASSISYVWKIGSWRPGNEAPIGPTATVTTGGMPSAPVAGPEAPPRTAGYRHAVAFSVFIPTSGKFSRSASVDGQGAYGPYHQRFSLSSQQATYYIGPSWGMRINDRVSIGASLFGIYGSGDGRATFAENEDVPVTGVSSLVPAFTTVSADMSTAELGLAVHLGLQVRPVSGLRLGLALRLPALRLWGRSTGATLLTADVDANYNLVPVFSDEEVSEGSGAAFARPFSMTIGLAWQSPGRFAIALDADYTTPWRWGGTLTRSHFNGRLGAEVFLAPRWILGLGAFTDVSPSPRLGAASALLESALDFFGGTLGVTYLSPFVVVGSEKTDRITFATTAGLKYAYGYGKIVGLDRDYNARTLAPALKDVRSHEVSVILGTGVRF